jgi:predicted PhzF superfamily epimerase YddE/YHI9
VLLLLPLPLPEVILTHTQSNPAAVCVGHGPEAWQQGLAQELNLSETAFVSFPASPSPSLGASRSPLERVLACACAQVELSFADVTTAIRSAFAFDPAASFSIGALASAKGQNLGSLHVMAVTKAFKLNRDASARLWGEHLASVLKDPAGDAHPNIRSFLGGGEVVFLDGAGNVADSPIVGFDAVGLASLARHGCSLLGARLDAARALVRATASEEDKNDTWADCVSLYLQSMRLENTTFESSGAQVSLLDSLAASETSALRPLEGDVVPSLVAESLRAGPGGILWAGIARCISQHVDIADDLAAQQPGLCVGALTVSRAQHPESWLALNFADLMGLDVRATLTLLATYPISAQDRGVCLGALRRTRAFSRPPTSCFTLKPPVASHKPPSFASHVDTLGLRWFTCVAPRLGGHSRLAHARRPTVEVDLCGHATLAAAHVLFTTRGALLDRSHVVFDTRGGKLSARRLGSGMVELDFPALMPELKGAAPGAVALALGLDERDVLEVRRNAMDSLALLREGVRLERLQPDMGKIRALGGRGLIVTAAAAQQPLEAPGTPGAAAAAHFTSRFFAPNAGIQEDPVTGSAHCALAPFWAQRLGLEPGAEMLGLQLSARRGCVYVANTSDGRVKLRGVANDVWSGTVRVPGSLLIEQI